MCRVVPRSGLPAAPWRPLCSGLPAALGLVSCARACLQRLCLFCSAQACLRCSGLSAARHRLQHSAHLWGPVLVPGSCCLAPIFLCADGLGSHWPLLSGQCLPTLAPAAGPKSKPPPASPNLVPFTSRVPTAGALDGVPNYPVLSHFQASPLSLRVPCLPLFILRDEVGGCVYDCLQCAVV